MERESNVRPRRWRPRDWPVRGKLAVVLIMPALVAIALGTSRVSAELDRAAQAGVLQDRNDLVAASTALTHQLQRERDLATRYVASGRTTGRAELLAQQAAVDQALPDVRTGLATLGAQDEGNRGRAEEAAHRLAGLPAIRSRADSPAVGERSLQAAYTDVISVLLPLTGTVAQATDDTSVQRTSAALSAVGRVIEQVKVEQSVLLGATGKARLAADGADAVRLAQAREQGSLADFAATATAEQRKLYSDVVDGSDTVLRTQLMTTALSSPDGFGIDPADWDQVSQAVAERMIRYESDLLDAQHQAAQRLGDEAKTSSLTDAAMVIGALLAAFAVTLYLASLLLRPLWILRRRALEVAGTELPEAIQRIEEGGASAAVSVAPVPVRSQEEIGDTARAFDAVHSAAVELATKQALLRTNVNDIFVNLSRRTQNLVEQQLTLIDQMEDGEQEPAAMDRLFRLDHLATRMRRNSENLLILAGVGLGRGSSGPVGVAEVLRAAVSEVEQYQRVVIRQVPPVAVQGTVAQDLVHLLAELLDNATVFSPPGSEVVLDARLTPSDELIVEVVDEGIGVADVTGMNQRLAEPPEVDAAVSRRLGLFVVSRLAARHGVTVRLVDNAGGIKGTTAQVLVPAQSLSLHRNGVPVGLPPAVNLPRPAVNLVETIPPPPPPPLPVAPPVPLEPALIYDELAPAWFRAADPDSPVSDEWQSSLDDLWRQAEGTASPEPDGLTEAGLPRRRRGAQLPPGRAVREHANGSPPPSTRDATAMHETLARYQEGLRRARGAFEPSEDAR
ncbi:sensor histidine kinase [Actinocrispum wychmicini]|uniref:histidine kinase n=1 Tax=Actinocrispum wychmicini TaxID=1213861 RepID=A0A4R2JNS1_9PSEU|nr:nitrate- and nitrite sensing domain-containing protein [Actinocrispum wychmicini]TCO60627.1 signal transduction histidine kinase [Actinocrispum wychmicini]